MKEVLWMGDLIDNFSEFMKDIKINIQSEKVWYKGKLLHGMSGFYNRNTLLCKILNKKGNN